MSSITKEAFRSGFYKELSRHGMTKKAVHDMFVSDVSFGNNDDDMIKTAVSFEKNAVWGLDPIMKLMGAAIKGGSTLANTLLISTLVGLPTLAATAGASTAFIQKRLARRHGNRQQVSELLGKELEKKKKKELLAGKVVK